MKDAMFVRKSIGKVTALILLALVGCTPQRVVDPLENLTEKNGVIIYGEVKNVDITSHEAQTDESGLSMPATAGELEIEAQEVFKGEGERIYNVSFNVAGSEPLNVGDKAIIFSMGQYNAQLTATIEELGSKKVSLWNGLTGESQDLDISLHECFKRIREYISAKEKREEKKM